MIVKSLLRVKEGDLSSFMCVRSEQRMGEGVRGIGRERRRRRGEGGGRDRIRGFYSQRKLGREGEVPLREGRGEGEGIRMCSG